MLRRSSLVLLALALGLSIAACGSDDSSDTTEVNETQVDSAAVVLPAHAVAAKDGAKSHSESDVYECSSTDLEGDVGSAAYGGFQDISVRGISCETGRERIVAVYDTYDDGEVAESVDGYDCSVIERYSDGLSTVRCFTPDGKASLRFTAVPAKKKAVELVAECGTYGHFHDVSVRGQSCQAGATFLDDTPTSELTAIPEGDEATVGGQACTTLYVEGGSRTVRCTKGKAALRVSIAPKPSTAHPARHVEKPQEVADFVAKTKKEPKPATTHGLSPNVTISCTSTGQFTAITSNGVNCAAVTVLLTRQATKLEAVQAGSTTQIGKYACQLISSGDETDTVQCTTPTGASFRATFAQPAAQPPSGGNPPATTTTTAAPAPSGGTTAPDDPVSTTP